MQSSKPSTFTLPALYLSLVSELTPPRPGRADVNNEAPSHAEEGANVKTDSESSKFDVAGSSGSNQAEL